MALWDRLLESKAARPAEIADASARSLAAGARAGLGNGVVLAGDTTEQVVEGHYRRVLWVWRCVDAIAQAEGSLPVYAWDSHDDEASRVDGFDHLERLLNGPDRPNKWEEYWEFRYRVSTLLLLATRGVFIEIVRDRATGDPAQLTILDSDAVEIVPDDQDRVKAYRVRYARGGMIRTRDLEPDRVLWLRSRPHPKDPYRQVTPLQAAGLSADTDFLARTFNASWLRNDGRVAQLIAIDTAQSSMSPEDVDAIKAMFGGGAARAGETRVIEAEKLSVAQVGGTPQDAQYVNLLAGTKEDILGAFGVSETALAWASGKTFDNADAELEVFWSQTMRWHCKSLASGFMPLVRAEGVGSGGPAILAHDFFRVPQLQRAGRLKADRAKGEFQAGLITIDEYLEATGRKAWKVPGTRVLWTPAGPIGPDDATTKAAQELAAAARPPQLPGTGSMAALPPGQGQGGGTATAADLQALAGSLRGVINDRAAESTRGRLAITGAKARLAASPERKAVPRTPRRAKARPRRSDVIDAEVVDERVEDPAETATADAAAALTKALGSVCRRMLGHVEGRLQSVKTRRGTRHWSPTVEEKARGWSPSRAIAETYVVQAERWSHAELEEVRAVVRSAASGAMAELRAELGVEPDGIYKASKVVRDLVNRLIGDVERGMAKRSREIARLVRRMDDAGASLDEIKAAVAARQAALDDWVARVAPRVAQAAVQGARKAMIDRVPDSVAEAVWTTVGDHRVRRSHRDVDGVPAKRGQGWTVGGYRMAFPGDPRVPAAQWINCRCRIDVRRPLRAAIR